MSQYKSRIESKLWIPQPLIKGANETPVVFVWVGSLFISLASFLIENGGQLKKFIHAYYSQVKYLLCWIHEDLNYVFW